MSRQTRFVCENCWAEAVEPLGWLKIDWLQVTVMCSELPVVNARGLDFCGPACLVKWVNERLSERRGRDLPLHVMPGGARNDEGAT